MDPKYSNRMERLDKYGYDSRGVFWYDDAPLSMSKKETFFWVFGVIVVIILVCAL